MKHSPHLAQLIEALRTLPGRGPEDRPAHGVPPAAGRAPGGARAAAVARRGAQRACAAAGAAACSPRRRCARSARPRSAMRRCCAWWSRPRMWWRSSLGQLSRPLLRADGPSVAAGRGGPGAAGRARARGAARRRRGAGTDSGHQSTVEGEATAHFLRELASARGIRATRIAHGVPVGGELEYVDGGTLAHALAGRQSL